ncbi:MAG: FHA domain-containing protein [Planctomycetes bacterium]|nr:FHA domain-containing protein [Planctomycetota bacterium]MBI3832732.1 FHA domain-containing protein [Planctomycetota bacterium]
MVTLIGSRSGCRVQVSGKHIAPVHVALVNDGHQVLGVDLLSASGTLLNELQMSHERLSDGDILEIHPYIFRVEIAAPEHNGNGDLHGMDLDPTPTAVALEHLDSSRILKPNREVCMIGRRAGCDIVVNDPNVSRVHALIFNYLGYPAIVDLISSNHTLVNSVAVDYQALKDGDIISVGESEFKVRLVGSKIVETAEKKLKAVLAPPPAPKIALAPADDLVDIHTVEGGQRWSVADNLDRLERAAKKRQAV